MTKKLNQWPDWPNARDWVGIGVFSLTVMLILLMRDANMREDEFFQTIATVIISNGFMAVVAWAYSATKGGGELADRNAALIEKGVKVNNEEDDPIPVKEKK